MAQIDEELSQTLEQYQLLRKRIGRGITGSLTGVPYFGGKDMLQWIATLERPNVTALADAMGITRGGASKAVGRLHAAALVTSYQLPENRKEVYYSLTPEGKHVLAELKNTLDVLHAREMAYIEQAPAEQKHAVLEFLTGFMAHLTAVWPPQRAEKEVDRQ